MQKELIEALKVAFCYMPEDHEIVPEAYGDNATKIAEEKKMVSNVLKAAGVDPDKVYAELNPPLTSGDLSPIKAALEDAGVDPEDVFKDK